MNNTSDETSSGPEDNASPSLLQQRILERTQSAGQRQTDSYRKLVSDGSKLKRANQNVKQIKKERKLVRKDLDQIKKDQNWFRKLIRDFCRCCCRCWNCFCCECCDCHKVEDNQRITTTTEESEEMDPNPEIVDKMWNKRYEPNTWYESMDENLRQLQKEAEEFERETNKQNKLIAKTEQKSKIEIKELNAANDQMTNIMTK